MGDREPTELGRGLVIGAGGAVGGAWAAGMLCALADTGDWDATALDVVVGTSAGSVLAALLGAGVPPRAMVEVLGGAADPIGGPLTSSVDIRDRVAHALTDIPWPLPFPGNLRLAARALGQPGRYPLRATAAALAPRGRGSLAPVGELIGEVCGSDGWAARPRTWLVAMDYDSGRRVTFGAAGQPTSSLPDAVMASCSVPGLFPPRRIGSRRYVDGGAISVTNADVLADAHLDEVLVLAPMTIAGPDPRRSAAARLDRRLRQYLTQRLAAEVQRLTAVGTTVRVFAPTAQDLEAMGTDPMDARRRTDVFETALRTNASQRIFPAA